MSSWSIILLYYFVEDLILTRLNILSFIVPYMYENMYEYMCTILQKYSSLTKQKVSSSN